METLKTLADLVTFSVSFTMAVAILATKGVFML
jgi:hypothetical protein